MVNICHPFIFSLTFYSFAIAYLQRRMLICARWITIKWLNIRGRTYVVGSTFKNNTLLTFGRNTLSLEMYVLADIENCLDFKNLFFQQEQKCAYFLCIFTHLRQPLTRATIVTPKFKKKCFSKNYLLSLLQSCFTITYFFCSVKF